jgi:cell division protein FtsW (lipid II flippase)
MVDSELQFVRCLIHESTLAVRFYFACTCGLLIVTIAVILLAFYRPSGLALDKIAPLVTTIFSAIPVPLFLSARYQRACLTYLKDRWEDAQAQNDVPAIEKLRIRLEELQNKVLEKGLGPIK